MDNMHTTYQHDFFLRMPIYSLHWQQPRLSKKTRIKMGLYMVKSGFWEWQTIRGARTYVVLLSLQYQGYSEVYTYIAYNSNTKPLPKTKKRELHSLYYKKSITLLYKSNDVRNGNSTSGWWSSSSSSLRWGWWWWWFSSCRISQSWEMRMREAFYSQR